MIQQCGLALRNRLKNVMKAVSRGARFHRTLLLARWRRSRCRRTTFIGITGSAGKTTAKELAALVLSTGGACQKSPGTSNEPVDVVKTIARMTAQHRFCVVELSAHRPGSLDQPLRVLEPDIGVLMVVARDHFSAYKSTEGIAVEKGKLISALPGHGIAVLNIDDPLIKALGERCQRRVIWIGKSVGATLKLIDARSQWPDPLTVAIEYQGKRHEVATKLYGTQNSLPVLAALGVGLAAGVPLDRAIGVLKDATPHEGRMQIVNGADGVVFVRDDWKAPYWAIGAVFDFVGEARAARKVIVIGTLSDYSRSPSKLYPKVAKRAREVADLVVFVGSHAMRALKARRQPDDQGIQAFPDIRDAAAYLRRELRSGDLVVLKGSNRADHLVRILLDRSEPVACWRSGCCFLRFCNRCSKLHASPTATAKEHAVSDLVMRQAVKASSVVRRRSGRSP